MQLVFFGKSELVPSETWIGKEDEPISRYLASLIRGSCDF